METIKKAPCPVCSHELTYDQTIEQGHVIWDSYCCPECGYTEENDCGDKRVIVDGRQFLFSWGAPIREQRITGLAVAQATRKAREKHGDD